MTVINAESLGFQALGFLGGLDAPISAAPAAAPSSYSLIYAFGDSLSDAGNDYILTLGQTPVSPPYSDGRFTNGAVWVQDLAADLKLPAVGPSDAGGTDFAYGGAETGQTPSHSLSAIDLPSQFAQFVAEDPHPKANALYTLTIGSNDVLGAITAYQTSPATAMSDISTAVQNEADFINDLAARGATNLLVLNVPDLGKTPAEMSQGPTVAAEASSLAATYDQELAASLQSLAASDHLNLHLVDTFSLLDQGIADPAAYGFTNVTTPVWTGNYSSASSGHLNATGAAQNQYLFWDSLHPTAHGHAMLASAAQANLTGVA